MTHNEISPSSPFSAKSRRRWGRALRPAGRARLRGAARGHGCVFGIIDDEGSRLTDLAARSGFTKQSVGEAVAELQKLGYVERVPDPADRRAKIIQLTPHGREA